MNMNKNFIALTLAMAMVVPNAQAGILKKAIIIGGVAYGAHAIAKNHREKKEQEAQQQYHNQPQNRNQYGTPYQNNPQGNPNVVNNPNGGYNADYTRPSGPRR